MLARELAKQHPTWLVELVNVLPFSLENSPENLSIICQPSIDDCLGGIPIDGDTVVIAAVSLLEHAGPDVLANCARRVLAWSHHPYDFKLRILCGRAKFAATVSVGEYQYCSNGLQQGPHFLINNLVFSLAHESSRNGAAQDSKSRLRIGHLGALVEEKGFLDVARMWPRLRSRFADCELHVVGSGALYRDVELHPLVPADLKFARRILEHIGVEDISSGRVTFHGRLGAEKTEVMERCSIAVQNPRGGSEAFPGSVLEWLSLGVPVIGSSAFGMWEFMKFFPELQIQSPEEIEDRIAFLMESPERLAEFQDRASRVAGHFVAQRNKVLRQWSELIVATACDQVYTLPVGRYTAGRSQTYFWREIVRRHWRIILSDSPLGAAYRLIRSRK